jgi:hypothetical protein
MSLTVPNVVFKTRMRDESIGGGLPFRWQDVSTDEIQGNILNLAACLSREKAAKGIKDNYGPKTLHNSPFDPRKFR